MYSQTANNKFFEGENFEISRENLWFTIAICSHFQMTVATYSQIFSNLWGSSEKKV